MEAENSGWWFRSGAAGTRGWERAAGGGVRGGVRGGGGATSQVFQDALGLLERGLALLGRLLCQGLGSIRSSQKLVCSLVEAEAGVRAKR